jgi:hypothetical protein
MRAEIDDEFGGPHRNRRLHAGGGAAVALKAGALARQIGRDRAAGYRLTSFTPYTPQTRAITIFGCGIGAVVLGVVFLINP